MKAFLSKLDGSKDVGYLTPRILGIIVAFAVVFSLVSWVRADRRPTIPLHAMVTISSTTAPGIGDVRNCKPIANRFSINVISGDKDASSFYLSDGEKQPDGSCFFQVKTDIIKADAYTIELNDRIGMKNPSVHASHNEALRTTRGHDRLLIFADW